MLREVFADIKAIKHMLVESQRQQADEYNARKAAVNDDGTLVAVPTLELVAPPATEAEIPALPDHRKPRKRLRTSYEL